MLSDDPERLPLSGTERQFQLYSSFISQVSLVFDVGANVGNRIEAMLRCCARVVAIEPQPDCIAILTHRYAKNRRVALVEAAVGATCGRADLFRARSIDPAASLSHDFIVRTRQSGRFSRSYNCKMSVAIVTLDDLIATHGY